MKLANGLKVSRNLLNRVGCDYFIASILLFKKGSACFHIDAEKIYIYFSSTTHYSSIFSYK